MNPLRIDYLCNQATRHFNLTANAGSLLAGIDVVDIGCGGGLLAEPLAQLGASVLGVDASDETIRVAELHRDKEEAFKNLDLKYRSATAEKILSEEESFDIVTALEIIEHVDQPMEFIKTCAGLLNPGGLLVMSTINRTPLANILAIKLAENVMGWVPKGTHQYEKFVTPEEIILEMERAGLIIDDISGYSYHPIFRKWFHLKSTAVSYVITAHKPNVTDVVSNPS